MQCAMNREVAIRTMLWLAAGAFLACWFLPVLPDLPGWAAFRHALAPLLPFRDASPQPAEDAAPQVMSALTNLVFVVLFVRQAWGRPVRAALLLRVAIACFLINLYWFVQMVRHGEAGGLMAGYYAWQLAFVLLAAIGVVNVVSDRQTSKTPTADRPA